MPLSIFVPSSPNDLALQPSGGDDTGRIADRLARAGFVLLGEGSFTITENLHPASNSEIAGMGRGVTEIVSGDLPRDDLSVGYTTNTQLRGKTVSHVTVRDLTFRGDNPSGNLCGISFDEGCFDCHVLRVETTGHSKPAVRFLGGGSRLSVLDCDVHDTIRFGSGVLLDQFPINGVAPAAFDDVQIAYNRFLNCGADFQQGAISVFNSGANCIIRGVRIIGNRIRGGTLATGGTPNGLAFLIHSGAFTEDVVVMGNLVKDQVATDGGWGFGCYIYLTRVESMLRNLTLMGNQFDSCNTGLFFQQDHPNILDGFILARNIFRNNTLANATIQGAGLPAIGSNFQVRDNVGFVTENKGTATVANGTTSIAVTHGLDATPALSQITVTPTNNLGSATKFWISNVTSTQFTINVDADPGSGTATFVWKAELL